MSDAAGSSGNATNKINQTFGHLPLHIVKCGRCRDVVFANAHDVSVCKCHGVQIYGDAENRRHIGPTDYFETPSERELSSVLENMFGSSGSEEKKTAFGPSSVAAAAATAVALPYVAAAQISGNAPFRMKQHYTHPQPTTANANTQLVQPAGLKIRPELQTLFDVLALRLGWDATTKEFWNDILFCSIKNAGLCSQVPYEESVHLARAQSFADQALEIVGGGDDAKLKEGLAEYFNSVFKTIWKLYNDEKLAFCPDRHSKRMHTEVVATTDFARGNHIKVIKNEIQGDDYQLTLSFRVHNVMPTLCADFEEDETIVVSIHTNSRVHPLQFPEVHIDHMNNRLLEHIRDRHGGWLCPTLVRQDWTPAFSIVKFAMCIVTEMERWILEGRNNTSKPCCGNRMLVALTTAYSRAH